MDSTALLRTVLLLIAIGANTLLGLIVITSNPKSATNRIFCTLSTVISIWIATNYLVLDLNIIGGSLLWSRLTIFWATPMSFLFFLLAYTIPKYTITLKQKTFFLLLLITVAVMLITLSPYAFLNVEIVKGSLRPIPGPGMLPFTLITTIYSIAAVHLLLKKIRRSTGFEREQYRYVMFGILLMLGLIILTILIPAVLFNVVTFVPFIPVYTLIFLSTTTYAIIRHRLLDIRLTVARAVTYTLLLLIIGVFYSAIFFIIGSKILGLPFALTDFLIYGSITFVVAITFQPLRRLIEGKTVKLFYKEHYEINSLLYTLSQIMASTISLNDLVTLLLKELMTQVHINTGVFILTNESKIHKVYPEGYTANFEFDEVLVQKLLDQNHTIIFDELQDEELKKIMRTLQLSVVVNLDANNKKVGLLGLGNKLSGDLYTAEDIRLLEITAPEAAVAIENSKSYEEIRRFNITLSVKIDNATKSLQEANDQLKVLDKLKDEFVSLASHELRTPMTAIKSYLWLFLQSKDIQLSSKHKLYLEHAYTATDRLINLVNDMLNVSRIESGRMDITPKPMSMMQVTKDVLDELSPTALKQQVSLILSPQSNSLPNVMADQNKIKEVLINLIGNSLKFTNPGGKVTVRLFKDNKLIITEITDTGKGIKEKDVPKLFHKFSTVGNNYLQKQSAQGTGLGLYISKSIVELHGGKIWADSAGENEGTTFSFSIPIEGSINNIPQTTTVSAPVAPPTAPQAT